jgi:RNA polymerase sigma-70 factor (ECF subfamily)
LDLAKLLETERERAYRVALRVCRDPELAVDAVQEACLSIVSAGRGRAKIRSPRAWFLKVVFRTALNFRKAASRRREMEAEWAMAKSTDNGKASCAAEQKELSRHLATALEGLDENHRLPLELRYREGLTCSEVAEILDRPRGTVSVYVARGLEQLRATLSKQGFAAAPAALTAGLGGMGLASVPERLLVVTDRIISSLPKSMASAGGSAAPGASGKAAAALGWTGSALAHVALLTVALVTALSSSPRYLAAPATPVLISEARPDPEPVFASSKTERLLGAPGAGGEDAWSRREFLGGEASQAEEAVPDVPLPDPRPLPAPKVELVPAELLLAATPATGRNAARPKRNGEPKENGATGGASYRGHGSGDGNGGKGNGGGKNAGAEKNKPAAGKPAVPVVTDKQVDAAVEEALAWLAKQQAPDGSWRHSEVIDTGRAKMVGGFNTTKGSIDHLTALTVLAFKSAGYSSGAGKYSAQLEKAEKFLLNRLVAPKTELWGKSGLTRYRHYYPKVPKRFTTARHDYMTALKVLAVLDAGERYYKTPPQKRSAVAKAIDHMQAWQCPQSGWSRHCPDHPVWFEFLWVDSATTLLNTLALAACDRLGYPLKGSTLGSVGKFLVDSRRFGPAVKSGGMLQPVGPTAIGAPPTGVCYPTIVTLRKVGVPAMVTGVVTRTRANLGVRGAFRMAGGERAPKGTPMHDGDTRALPTERTLTPGELVLGRITNTPYSAKNMDVARAGILGWMKQEYVDWMPPQKSWPRRTLPDMVGMFERTLALRYSDGPEWKEWQALLRGMLMTGRGKRAHWPAKFLYQENGALLLWGGAIMPDGALREGDFHNTQMSTALAVLMLESHRDLSILYRTAPVTRPKPAAAVKPAKPMGPRKAPARKATSPARLLTDREVQWRIERATAWLAARQSSDGSWTSKRFPRRKRGEEKGRDKWLGMVNVRAVRTSLALLALVGAGNSQFHGKHRNNVRSALKWLLQWQWDDKSDTPGSWERPSGDTWDKYRAAMAADGLATLALLECQRSAKTSGGMDPLNIELRKGVDRAVSWLHKSRISKLGWSCAGTRQFEVHAIIQGRVRPRVGRRAANVQYWRRAGQFPAWSNAWTTLALKAAMAENEHVERSALETVIYYLDNAQGESGQYAAVALSESHNYQYRPRLSNAPAYYPPPRNRRSTPPFLSAMLAMRMATGTEPGKRDTFKTSDLLFGRLAELAGPPAKDPKTGKATPHRPSTHFFLNGALAHLYMGGERQKRWQRQSEALLASLQRRDGSWPTVMKSIEDAVPVWKHCGAPELNTGTWDPGCDVAATALGALALESRFGKLLIFRSAVTRRASGQKVK